MVAADGEQIGIQPLGEAFRTALGQELDLVEIAPKASPPVCRIMDYGKYRYLQKKKDQESKKHQTQVMVKEVKLGARTSEHDVDFKTNHIRRFIEKKHRVKVSVFFRGREITHPEIGRKMLDRVCEKIEDIAVRETVVPRMEGRNMSILVVPK